MKHMMIVILAACVAAVTGCATKTRNVELSGMYVSEAGTLAIGDVEVQAAPVGEESAMIRYEEDTAWLSPSTKIHTIKIMLTGTNSVASAGGIVADICSAFKQIGVEVAQANNGIASTSKSKAAATIESARTATVAAPTVEAVTPAADAGANSSAPDDVAPGDVGNK